MRNAILKMIKYSIGIVLLFFNTTSVSILGACILGRFMDEREEEKKRLAVASAVN